MSNFWNTKKVLVTGACGTVGSEIITQLFSLSAELIVGIDNNESELFFIREACEFLFM